MHSTPSTKHDAATAAHDATIPQPRPAAKKPDAAARTRSPLRLLVVPLIAVMLLFIVAEAAEARRMGGGGSFGSRPSYNQGAPARQGQSQQRQTNREQQTAPGQQAAQGTPARMGGMGGMLGGLLMGGLIGSMLFGGGMGGGMGMLEILLLAGGAFLIFRLIKSRREAATATASPYSYSGGTPQGQPMSGSGGWGHLNSASPAPESAPASVMPNGMDEQEFLSGAKMLFNRLQASWDRRDLDDIREFTSPEVHAEIVRQASDDPGPSRTEVLMLEGRVVESRQEGSETIISVLFDALMREDQSAAQAAQVREVWHFSRDEAAPRPQWTLEGIQQLEV